MDNRILLVISHNENTMVAIERAGLQDNARVVHLVFGEEVAVIIDDTSHDILVDVIQEYPDINVLFTSKAFNYQNLRLVYQKGASFEQEELDYKILYNKGRFLLVDNLGYDAKPCSQCWYSEPVTHSKVIFQNADPNTVLSRHDKDFGALLESIDLERIKKRLQKLEDFNTRYCYSATYDSAAKWAEEIFEELGYTTQKQVFDIGNEGHKTSNIIATRQASQNLAFAQEIIITAHLDSINHENKSGFSPGADDNGSGVVACLEMAQILSQQLLHHNITFILFGAEEIGLLGSRYFVSQLSQERKGKIMLALNMDMVGCHNSQTRKVLIEGTESIKPIMDEIAQIATIHTKLKVQHSYNPFASDHVSFIRAGIPSFLTIEGDDQANKRIHTKHDTVDTIDFVLLLEIIKMNLAFVLAKLI